MKGFKNVRAYVRGEGVIRTDIGIEDGRIKAIGSLPDIEPLFDCGENLLAPGFIDTHIHGAGGADVMDGTQAALSIIAETLVKEGTTAFLATTMTQSEEAMTIAVKAAADYRDSGKGAAFLGVHAEGPFLSEKYAGAQPREFMLPPSSELFDRLQTAAKGKIKIVTFAPENDEDFAFTKYLKKSGVVCSVGHSAADGETVCEGVRHGIDRVTHTFNAQSPFRHREIGVVGAALLSDDIYTELVADTVHVSVPAMKILIKNKPKNKIVLITDAMRAKGMADGVYELGGQTVYVRGGRAELSDGTLAGSVLKMNVAVKNTVEKCGVDICTALDFASYDPAESIGASDERGSIKIGSRADFTLLGETFDIVMTSVGGRIVYKDR